MEKTCRCGKTKKSFRVDIGPFFIDECCVEAGYDHMGKKSEPLLTVDELKQAESLQIQDEPELSSSVDEVSPEKEVSSPQVKSKRSYGKNGNKKE